MQYIHILCMYYTYHRNSLRNNSRKFYQLTALNIRASIKKCSLYFFRPATARYRFFILLHLLCQIILLAKGTVRNSIIEILWFVHNICIEKM